MLTQTLKTQAIKTQIGGKIAPARSVSEQFGAIAGHAGLVATEFSYRKDEEIYGEDEPAEYVYQVVSGAVRSYKLLSDGRRQIGAFHLPGDVFGLEPGQTHRLAAEAIIATSVRLMERASIERSASTDVQVARKLWAMTAGELRHAQDHMPAAGAQDGDGACCNLPARNGSPPRRRRHDGTADVSARYRRLSRPHARDRIARALAASRKAHTRLLRRPPDRTAQPPAPAQSRCLIAFTRPRFSSPTWPAERISAGLSCRNQAAGCVSGQEDQSCQNVCQLLRRS
ncbi:CRP-like cAMP-binding protein [Bradyrhizobium sp. LM4.3]